MKLFNQQGEAVCEAKNCKEPKFSSHRGRTWDSTDKIIDGEPVEWWFDSSWGFNMYFALNGKWYSTPVAREDHTDGLTYKEKLFTKEGLKNKKEREVNEKSNRNAT